MKARLWRLGLLLLAIGAGSGAGCVATPIPIPGAEDGGALARGDAGYGTARDARGAVDAAEGGDRGSLPPPGDAMSGGLDLGVGRDAGRCPDGGRRDGRVHDGRTADASARDGGGRDLRLSDGASTRDAVLARDGASPCP
ncbi:MAG: hypothetical protein IT371_20300 [Deltaproteobacteria bacterium]|nr:hypothetical protein [Deltaproteobacteria bacterium]